MNQNILRPDDNLGHILIPLPLTPWETVKFKEKLSSGDKATIEFTARFIPLFNEDSDQLRDLFGFDFGIVTGTTRAEYENALFGCERFSTMTQFKQPFWKDTQTTAKTGIGFVYKASVWEWVILSKLEPSPVLSKLTSPNFYAHVREQKENSLASEQIDRDVDRTFSLHHCFSFSAGRDTISRVLKAIAIHLPHIGYCQGMNSLVAFLVMVTTEEKAFRLAVLFVEHILGSAYHISGLAGVQIDQLIVEDCLTELLPALAQHFAHFDVSVSLLTTEWFLTLFAGALPFHTTLRIWDLLCYYGRDVIVCAAFALIKIHENALLEIHDFEQIKDYVFRKTRLLFDENVIVPHILQMLPKKDWKALRGSAGPLLTERQMGFDWHIQKLTTLSLGQIKNLRSRFEKSSIHGVITPAQFHLLFEEPLASLATDNKMGPKFWGLFDKSKNQTIEFKQFCIGVAPLVIGTPEDKMRFCFRLCDFAGKGQLNEQEIKTILAWQYRSLGNQFDESTLEQALRFIFGSKDDRLAMEDFVEFFKPSPLCSLLSVNLESDCASIP